MIREQLMAAGTFDLSAHLAPELFDSLSGFDQVLVLPAQFPSGVTDPDTLLPFASFTGIVRELAYRDGVARLSGPSNAGWLGDGQRRGPGYPTGLHDEPLDTSLFALFAAPSEDNNGITLGDADGVPTDDIVVGYEVFTRGFTTSSLLDWLLEVCEMHNIEFRVNANHTIDFGPPDNAAIWTQDPQVFICEEMSGSDFRYSLLTGTFTASHTWQDYATDVLASAFSENPPASATSNALASDPTPPKGADYTTSAEFMHSLPQITIEWGANGHSTDRADNALAHVYKDKDKVSVTVDVHDPTRHFRIGDMIGLWAPRSRIYDFTNERVALGETMFPLFVRCVGWTRPIRRGMGVYIVANDGGAVTDITEWVDFEDGDVRLEVGFKQPTLTETVTRQRRQR